MSNLIEKTLKENLRIGGKLLKLEPQIRQIAREIVNCLKKGNKLFFLGNGGSAADAIHMSGEYVGKFSKIRRGLPAIALSANITAITAIANDWDYAYVFWRQLKSLANKNDLVISFSTSGESKNIIAAIKYCKKQGIKTISFTASQKNTVADLSDICIQCPSRVTARVQESYILINHIICELVDEVF